LSLQCHVLMGTVLRLVLVVYPGMWDQKFIQSGDIDQAAAGARSGCELNRDQLG